MKWLIVFSLLLFEIAKGDAISDRLQLKEGWKYFSKERNCILPFNSSEKTSVLFFKLDISKYSNAELEIELSKNQSLFIDNKTNFVNHHKRRTVLNFKLDSLKNFSDTLFISITQGNKNFEDLPKAYLVFSKIGNPVGNKNWFNSDFVEFSKAFNSKLLFIFLFGLMFYAIVFNLSPRLFADFFSIEELLYGIKKEKFQILARVDRVKIAYMALISFLLSSFYFLTRSDSSGYTRDLFMVALFVFLFLVFKLLVLFSISWLYKIKNIYEVQFYFQLKLFFIFSTLMILAFLTLMNVVSFDWQKSNIEMIAFILFAFYFFIQFVVVKSISSIQSFYIFSYLCVTEIVPFLFLQRVWNQI